MDWLQQSLHNLYNGNMILCSKQGIWRELCEKRIGETIKRIQWITKKVCWEDMACNLRWLEWHIDNEEIERLRLKLLLTYT